MISLLKSALLAFAVLLGAACSNGAMGPADGAAGSDAACRRGCVLENNEDCEGCFRHIGTCCYNDVNWEGVPTAVQDLVATCFTRADCAMCCNECKALSCDEIVARHDCPNR